MSKNLPPNIYYCQHLLSPKSRLTHPQLLSQLYSYPSLLKQHVTLFQPRVIKLIQLPRCTTNFQQFHRYFCSRGTGSRHEEQKSVKFVQDTNSQSTQASPKLSHVDTEGHARMVDIGSKGDTNRVAMAMAMVHLGPESFSLVKENKIVKGDVLTVAQLAGIMACKLTPSLIPLCHNIQITHSEVNLELDEENFAVCITGTVNSVGKTGVEMESLTAVTIAALTVYDMCKAVSRDIVISDVKLVRKSGGKSGDYVNV